jgi:hypothetical protein
MDQAFSVLLAFIVSQLAIICMGMVPQKYWRGIQARGQQPKAVLAGSAVAKQLMH